MFDIAIIGSGVSGGRMAFDLTRGGARCVLIEAGQALDASTFPRNELDSASQMFWGGGMELSSDGRFGFLRAKCVGGTSVVNQALLDRFDTNAWSDWKARTGVQYFSEKEMESAYDAVESRLSLHRFERSEFNRNATIFTEACDRLGCEWKPLTRGQKNCRTEQGSDCIACLGGCRRNSKQSALITSIREALSEGLELRSRFQVDQVVEARDGVRVVGKHEGHPSEIRARKVVLAAGSFGTTTLLLRSGLGSKLSALGKGFTCHPQYMTFARFRDPVDAHKGAFQTVKSADSNMRRDGYKLENVFAPPIATAMLLDGYGSTHARHQRAYRHLASIEVAVRDDPVGEIRISRNGRIQIQKSLTDSDRTKMKKGLEMVHAIFTETRAEEIIPCKQAFGLHLMGGCSIGTNPLRSVVDPTFRIHGSRRLFVADSSIFPSAPGINPSLTIMALTHRAAKEVLAA